MHERGMVPDELRADISLQIASVNRLIGDSDDPPRVLVEVRTLLQERATSGGRGQVDLE